MTTFKTTQEIMMGLCGISLTVPPYKYDWLYIEPLLMKDVDIWEEIYYEAGSIGIYAAWRPKAELYILVHELFLETQAGIEFFYGINAEQFVWDRARELGLNLPITRTWIDNKDVWLHKNDYLTPP